MINHNDAGILQFEFHHYEICRLIYVLHQFVVTKNRHIYVLMVLVFLNLRRVCWKYPLLNQFLAGI